VAEPIATLPKLDSRIPAWRLDKLQERQCPICGNEGPALAVRPDMLVSRKCQSCDTVYISPAPTLAALDHFYSEYSLNHSRRQELTEQYAQLVQHTSFSDDLRIVEISSYLNLVNSNILDVGCGAGETLVQLNNAGANVLGIDLDAEAINFVSSLLKLRAIRGDIRKTAIDAYSPFDLILMFDFIEHPLLPIEYIKRSLELLRNGGFFAIWTPNGSNINASSDYLHLRVDLEHMQYLSFQSCFSIAEQFGLRIVHLEGIGHADLDNIELPLMEQRGRLAAASHKLEDQESKVLKKAKGALRRLGLAYQAVRYGIPPQLAPMLPNLLHRRDGQYHLFAIFQLK
jgi:2-polyprenyl-3-methyl-5-hydroxy-6-metoxy-1,4-benzoquinol methylase